MDIIKWLIITIMIVVSTYILHRRFREIKVIIAGMWGGFIGTSSVMIYKQYQMGEIYYNYIDVFAWLVVCNIFLSSYLLLADKTKLKNTKFQVKMYIFIIIINLVLLLLMRILY